MKIEIYTTPTCPACAMLKKELVDLNPIMINCYEETEKVTALGINGVPVVIINDVIKLYKPTAEEVRRVIEEGDIG